MKFNKGDKVYLGNGPMEFVGIVIEGDDTAGPEAIRVSGVELGCETSECEEVTISTRTSRTGTLCALSESEFVERTKHEPAFGGVSLAPNRPRP